MISFLPFSRELKSAAQFNRGPPGFSTASRLHFDLLLSRDDRIEYGDYLKYGEPYWKLIFKIIFCVAMYIFVISDNTVVLWINTVVFFGMCYNILN